MMDEPLTDEAFSDQEHMHASFRGDTAGFLRSFREEMEASIAIKEENEEDYVDKEEEHPMDPPPVPKRGPQRRRSSLLKKTLLKTFSSNEERTVLKVLRQISSLEERHYQHGFNETNFTAGVMNCFLVAYGFGAYPEHFWLIYLVQSLLFIPLKFRNMIRARPLNEALYYFDFCWMMNFNAILSLVMVASPIPLPPSVRRFVFRGAFGIACGPLLGATMILPFVAFVFHDVNTMTNVVIHALPPMLLYTMRWHAEEIRQAWPRVFALRWLEDSDYFPNGSPFFLPGTGLGSIAGNAVLIYLLWFIPYTSWMLLVGMDLPRKNHSSGNPPKYDTVFHSFWRAGSCKTFGTLLWKRPVEVSAKQVEMDDYETRDFLAYMGIHAFLVLLAIPILGGICNYSKATHMGLMLLVLLVVVHRGSQRYTYYTTKMFSRAIKKEFLSDRKCSQVSTKLGVARFD